MITLGKKDGTYTNPSYNFTSYFLFRILVRLLLKSPRKARDFISQIVAKLGYFLLFLLLNLMIVVVVVLWIFLVFLGTDYLYSYF